jgi:hypothetical protein
MSEKRIKKELITLDSFDPREARIPKDLKNLDASKQASLLNDSKK